MHPGFCACRCVQATQTSRQVTARPALCCLQGCLAARQHRSPPARPQKPGSAQRTSSLAALPLRPPRLPRLSASHRQSLRLPLPAAAGEQPSWLPTRPRQRRLLQLRLRRLRAAASRSRRRRCRLLCSALGCLQLPRQRPRLAERPPCSGRPRRRRQPPKQQLPRRLRRFLTLQQARRRPWAPRALRKRRCLRQQQAWLRPPPSSPLVVQPAAARWIARWQLLWQRRPMLLPAPHPPLYLARVPRERRTAGRAALHGRRSR